MCQGQSCIFKKIAFLELFLRTIEEDKWNLFEKLGQLRTPTPHIPVVEFNQAPMTMNRMGQITTLCLWLICNLAMTIMYQLFFATFCCGEVL